jgi:hypothetical protein
MEADFGKKRTELRVDGGCLIINDAIPIGFI